MNTLRRSKLTGKLNLAYLILLISGPLVLIILPADFFDTGQSVCLSVLLLDQTCGGCGMTRAIQHLIHFDFSAAYAFNKLSVLVLPLLIFLWFGEVKRIYRKLKRAKENTVK